MIRTGRAQHVDGAAWPAPTSERPGVGRKSYDLGYFYNEGGRLEPIANPFAAKVLPIARYGL